MVKDDYFFLEKWINYYGGMFGKKSLYIINHGDDDTVNKMAQGCNVTSIPGGFDKQFDSKRWRLLNHFANGLRSYYSYVVCGDVDEFLVFDPKTGLNLADFIAKRRKPNLITPLGLEVVHRPDIEPDSVENSILGPRQYCRFSTYFCKPCLIGREAVISRGGHYADRKEKVVFKNLYLFHMKYCDHGMYKDTMNRRGIQMDKLDQEEQVALSAEWMEKKDVEEDRLIELANLPVREEFDFSERLTEMDDTWGQRENSKYWHFKKHVGRELYPIPDRFSGII